MPVTRNANKVYLKKGMTAMVIEAFDGNLYVNILDHIFALEEVATHEAKSKTFDHIDTEDKQKKIYIPPMTHPWKHASFQSYLAKQKHRQSGANV